MAGQGKVTAGVVRYIRKNIEEGAWRVGERIPSENELCALLGVSRVSVRSAIRQMAALGVVESIHGKGTYLRSTDLSAFGEAHTRMADVPDDARSEMRQILEFRLFLEPPVCEAAANRIPKEDVERLEELLGNMREAIGQRGAFVAADMAFHLTIAKSVGNPILDKTLSDLLAQKMEAHARLNRAVGYYGGMYYHALILDALRRHDAKHAGALMEEHLRHSLDEIAEPVQAV